MPQGMPDIAKMMEQMGGGGAGGMPDLGKLFGASAGG